MRKARLVPAVLALVAMGPSACRDGGPPGAESLPWSLHPSVVEAGAGIPFCEESTARVAEFMGRFEGQAPPSERYGGTVQVGVPGEMGGGMNAHVSDLHESNQLRFEMCINSPRYPAFQLRYQLNNRYKPGLDRL